MPWASPLLRISGALFSAEGNLEGVEVRQAPGLADSVTQPAQPFGQHSG